MSKGRCALCGKGPAKRNCRMEGNIMICPVCCASIRYDDCGDCSYYKEAKDYHRERQREKKFVTLIDMTLEDECDRLLALAEKGHLSEVEEGFKVLLKGHPNYHTVLYGMGVCCALQERLGEAVEFFKKAIKIFPPFTEAHYNLAMAYLKNLDIPGVVTELMEVVRIGDDSKLVKDARDKLADMERMIIKTHGINMDTYLKNHETFQKAFNFLHNGEYTTAITLFQKVLSVEPGSVQSWGNLGIAYAGIGDKVRAIRCFDKALEIDPEYELAMVNKMFVENMREGESIDQIDSVEYYKDYRVKKRSYIAEVLGKLKDLINKMW